MSVFKVFLACGIFIASSPSVIPNNLYPVEYVTSTLEGQLGNQMFQIATTVAYALDHGYKAVFPNLRFALKGAENTQYIFHRLDTSRLPNRRQKPYVYRENQFTHYTIYAPIPLVEGRDMFLDGYFQTSKYFDRHADAIRALFAPTESLVRQIEKQYGEILKRNTVALHVRTFTPDGRNPNEEIGVRGWRYYQKAMSLFPVDSVFLVFSDDMAWVKNHFPQDMRDRVRFIEGNHHCIDLYLMSFCKHQILSSQSTFSWWAAWLNSNPNKIVVAPKWGFRPDAEIMLPEWIQLTERDL